MADIDSIIAGVSGNTRADFANFDPVKAYFDANSQRAAKDLRDAFKPTADNPNGLPMNGGQLDYPAMVKTLIQKGALDQGLAVAKLGLEQQNLAASQQIDRNVAGGSPVQFPVSASRANGVADPAFRRDTSTDQPAPGATPLPPDQQQDPNSGVYRMPQQEAVQAWRDSVRPVGGAQPQVQPPTQQGQPQAIQIRPQPAPQQVAQAPQVPAPDFNSRFNAARPGQGSDATLGGLIPPGRTVKQQVDLLNEAIASKTLNPDQAKAYHSRLEAIYKAIAADRADEATTGRQELADTNKTQLQILEKSTLPMLDKSRDTTVAAAKDIDAIHAARTELDRSKGIFSGAWAEQKLQAAKFANALGVKDADQITSTEAYRTAIGERVKQIVKAFGSGTGISEGDRRYSQQIAGGSIELNETSLRRILDIAEKVDRVTIDRHNILVDRAVKSNEGLKPTRDTYVVEQPQSYTIAKAKSAIAEGAPRDAVIKRLRDAGHNPAGL